MGSLNGVGGIGIAIFLLILGVIMLVGILTPIIDIAIRIIGLICIVAALVIGGMAIFGKKNRY